MRILSTRARRIGAALVALVALAACADAPIVQPAYLHRYTPGYAGLFAAAGQLEMIGGARDEAETARLAQVAADNIPLGSRAGALFTLTPRGQDDPQRKNRVVMAIGGGNQYLLCSEPPLQGGRFGGQALSVAIAACNGEDLLSATTARVGGLTGVDDPRLALLFRQIGAELFPQRNPRYQPSPQGGSYKF